MLEIHLNDYQYEELQKKILFLNKYDFDFKYIYEMNRYWKEFCFDLINELYQKDLLDTLYNKDSKLDNINYLLSFLKNNYQQIIDDNKLTIDFQDYIELNDYITLDDWLKDPHHQLKQNEMGFFLIQE